MPRPDHVLAIDQGTTSTRAILFDSSARPVAKAQRELTQHYPQPGWVEHDPEEIWQSVVSTAREVMAAVEPRRIAGIGITNQRETTVVWDRSTGEPIHRAIVWQDRRTGDTCARLKGEETLVSRQTGLLLDPYFSATKIGWMLDNIPGARERADKGELAFGTIDSFLLWRLTGGAVHATDITNASRTMLFDIREGGWDAELCRLFEVPEALLPVVHGNSRQFGVTEAGVFDVQTPIAGMAGDQQAALFGQGCFKRGMVKSTYGTGCFMLLNTGEEAVQSRNRLLTTPAYRLDGMTHYALEGSIFVAGAAIKWLRNGLGVIADDSQTDSMATRVQDDHGVYMVPAFVGMGAPYWEADARAAIFGLTLGTTGAHLARAALEAVIAKDAAVSHTDEQLGRLRDALQLMRDTIGDEPAFNQADVVFHAVVGEMTENRLADNIVKTLFHQARVSARFSRHSELELTLDEHEAVFAAIEAGDPDAAESAMRTHILDAWERRRPPSPRH